MVSTVQRAEHCNTIYECEKELDVEIEDELNVGGNTSTHFNSMPKSKGTKRTPQIYDHGSSLSRVTAPSER
jgi:hypothetical protein